MWVVPVTQLLLMYRYNFMVSPIQVLGWWFYFYWLLLTTKTVSTSTSPVKIYQSRHLVQKFYDSDRVPIYALAASWCLLGSYQLQIFWIHIFYRPSYGHDYVNMNELLYNIQIQMTSFKSLLYWTSIYMYAHLVTPPDGYMFILYLMIHYTYEFWRRLFFLLEIRYLFYTPPGFK